MVYSITVNNKTEVVFGKAFRVPSYPTPVIKDIFGDDVLMFYANTEADDNANRDRSIAGTRCQIIRNMELGKSIIAKFREYVIRRNDELGISGNGITLLQNFNLIAVALLTGMLYEASSLILQMPEDQVITAEIKQKFSLACLSADHLTY